MNIESNKIKGEAKSIKLNNGVVLTYAEKGEKNEEVMITGAFYHHTFMPVVEGLSRRYHVYAVVMRFSGPTEELEKDGTTNWTKQWGRDIYNFALEMKINKFHYIGKCHGTIPGWWLVKNHPEVLIDFCSFFLGPHLQPNNSNQWDEKLASGKMKELMSVALRKPESGIKKKMEEMASLGNLDGKEIELASKWGGFPEYIWDKDLKAVEKSLKNTNIPIGYLFGTDDILFNDYYDANMLLFKITKGCHFTILQGERHLMEIDCPERVVDEAFYFIDQAHKNYDE